jgi:hypothetical protein
MMIVGDDSVAMFVEILDQATSPQVMPLVRARA